MCSKNKIKSLAPTYNLFNLLSSAESPCMYIYMGQCQFSKTDKLIHFNIDYKDKLYIGKLKRKTNGIRTNNVYDGMKTL